MPKYRSATTTHGRNMAGAPAPWRAPRKTDRDFWKPIIAPGESFTPVSLSHLPAHQTQGALRFRLLLLKKKKKTKRYHIIKLIKGRTRQLDKI
ncbi:hypothetical protein, partial [Salmonella enterica]|uniref:hypothetical protein n=1 Tax=Salmonella enterica TaxID=28901 RepID=UPI000A8BB243